MATCKYCGEPIVWGKDAHSGRMHPYNENGRSHFNTCQHAQEVRNKNIICPRCGYEFGKKKEKTTIQPLYSLDAYMHDKKKESGSSVENSSSKS